MRLSPEAADTASLIATSLKETDEESHEPIANSPTTYAAMFSQSIMRASRQSLARVARQQNTTTLRRTFAVSAVVKADIVQDLYLKELKAYKAPAVKASDSEGHVQKFSIPAAPPSPEEADIASELKAYESQVPEVEGQAEAGAAPVEQDWFEEPVEEEEGHGAH